MRRYFNKPSKENKFKCSTLSDLSPTADVAVYKLNHDVSELKETSHLIIMSST